MAKGIVQRALILVLGVQGLLNEQIAEEVGLNRQQVGVWRNAGYKLGRWHDVGWYQRSIRELDGEPPPFVPFSELT